MNLAGPDRTRMVAIAVASGIALALLARLFATDSAPAALGIGVAAAIVSIVAGSMAIRPVPASELASWVSAARSGELTPPSGPGLRLDLLSASGLEVVMDGTKIARSLGQNALAIEHLVLASLRTDDPNDEQVAEILRDTVSRRQELLGPTAAAQVGWNRAAISAVEAAYGEAVMERSGQIEASHLARGCIAVLRNPMSEGPEPALRPAILERLLARPR